MSPGYAGAHLGLAGAGSGAGPRGGRLRALLLVAAVIGCGACAPKDAGVRRERLAAERRSLEATFDQLEDRLVASQARVHFWQEMRTRHESVAAIACSSLEGHAEEMAKRLLPAEHKRAELHSSLDLARVAAAPRQPST